MNLQDKIPTVYHSIFPEILDIDFPDEQIATCNNCTLCRSPQSSYINTKCCTYHPHLANFLIGALLTDNEISLAIGKQRILTQIKASIGITPYGIIPSVPYSIRQKDAEEKDFWTRSKVLMELQICPYFEKGQCTVWKYRENLCVTHFCSSTGGSAGKIFWKKVNTYLKMAETSLAQYAMVQLGWPPSEIKTDAVITSDFNLEDEQGVVNKTTYTRLWGKWVGREEEFYKSCYAIIQRLDAQTFKQITGMKREILDAAIRDTSKDFQQNVIPDYLILHPNIVSEIAKEGYTTLFLEKKMAEIPSVIFPLIRGFNGKRKAAEVFHLAYNILFNMSELVDELREKGMLIDAKSPQS